MGLNPKTLVSIQPFNRPTVAFRKTALELQQEAQASMLNNPAWCSIAATGSTPLVEVLANSAVFLRERPSDLAIGDDAIRNTTIVLLTDGQANGPANGGLAKDAVYLMQTTSFMQPHSGRFSKELLSAVQVPGVTRENYLSYGLEGFSCRVLPVVFPISIGTDSDAYFMNELAARLHMPQAFVSTDENMQAEIDDAMSVLHNMLVRVPQVFVGLRYQQAGKASAVGVEEHNVFNQRSRTVYLRVPKDATELELCMAIGSSTHVVSGVDFPQQAITDENQISAIINEYVKNSLMEIQMEYSKDAQDLLNNIPADEKQNVFNQLKEKAMSAARSLLSLSCSVEIRREIELFISTVNEHESIESVRKGVASTRGAIAKYTQSRALGQQLALPTHTIDNTVFADIQNANFDEARRKITQDPTLLNSMSTDQYRSTPLISAIVKREKAKDDQASKDFIGFLLSQTDIDLTLQDASGNTALHRAAWYGLFEECREMLLTAKVQGQLDTLKRKTNRATAGATTGETFLDNIRRSKNLTAEEKEALFRLSAELLAGHYQEVNTAAQLNGHIEPHWNTPIMQLLRDLKGEANKSSADELRSHILSLLEIPGINLWESNFNGDTALHYAIWYGEFEIAKKIIEKTPADEKALLFAARNSVGLTHETGGEVPHMNLALSGKNALVRFSFDPTLENQAQLEAWLKLAGVVAEHVDAKQMAELTHLMQMYGKVLEGYSENNFLRAAPINAFNKLITQCESLKAQSPLCAQEAGDLLTALQKIKTDFSEKTIDALIADLRSKMNVAKQAASSTFATSPLVNLYREASEMLTRLKAYVNGEEALLFSKIEEASAITPPSPTDRANGASETGGSAASSNLFAPVKEAGIPMAGEMSPISDSRLDKLIADIRTYHKGKSNSAKGTIDDHKFRGAELLLDQLLGFKSRRITAEDLRRKMQQELTAPSYHLMFKVFFGKSKLQQYFMEARDMAIQFISLNSKSSPRRSNS